MKSESSWIWGFHSVEAALKNYPELVNEIQFEPSAQKDFDKKIQSLADKAKAKSKLEIKKVARLPRTLSEKRHQGIAALLKQFPIDNFLDLAPALAASGGQIAFLDGVQDPRNYGAILRSAGAFGVEAVLVGTRNQCPLTGVVAQASAGNLFALKNGQVRQLKDLWEWAADNDYTICALDGRGEDMEKFFSVRLKTGEGSRILWLLGAEGEGLHAKIAEKAQKVLKIPMQAGVESLNVSVAASIAFYRAAQLKAGQL